MSYPRWRYHKTQMPEGKIVRSEEENEKLGSGWVDSPAHFESVPNGKDHDEEDKDSDASDDNVEDKESDLVEKSEDESSGFILKKEDKKSKSRRAR